MRVLFWVVFIGLCINTGALLLSTLVSLFTSSASRLPGGLDLSALYQYDTRLYIPYVSLVIALSALKAYMAYLMIKIVTRFDLDRPFNTEVALLVTRIGHVALEAAVLALLITSYGKWVQHRGVELQPLDGTGEWLFLAGVIFTIAHVFRRGVEFQAENDLTV
ncbi:hypothetical protein GCM10023185_33520 [Hymenobacter saemangeumensis]|uniref:DUF2975 domain-containing protein n=1 Tax=Hymenobacter saemangeumensis TaxID=1084522 RepID=A0ABP8INE3_9BACT